jgi:hypothetical protein
LGSYKVDGSEGKCSELNFSENCADNSSNVCIIGGLIQIVNYSSFFFFLFVLGFSLSNFPAFAGLAGSAGVSAVDNTHS